MREITLKSLAEEFGTDVETLRRMSTVGEDVTEEQELTELQEQNVRNSWVQQNQSTKGISSTDS